MLRQHVMTRIELFELTEAAQLSALAQRVDGGGEDPSGTATSHLAEHVEAPATIRKSPTTSARSRPAATCSAGPPRRSVASSMMSSWTSDARWRSSIETAAGSERRIGGAERRSRGQDESRAEQLPLARPWPRAVGRRSTRRLEVGHGIRRADAGNWLSATPEPRRPAPPRRFARPQSRRNVCSLDAKESRMRPEQSGKGRLTGASIALERGTRFLLANQGRDGLWRDFLTPAGEASEWPTGLRRSRAPPRRSRARPRSSERPRRSSPARTTTAAGATTRTSRPMPTRRPASCSSSRDGSPREPCRRAASCLVRHQRRDGGGIATYREPGPIRRFMGVGRWLRFNGWCRPHTEVTATARLRARRPRAGRPRPGARGRLAATSGRGSVTTAAGARTGGPRLTTRPCKQSSSRWRWATASRRSRSRVGDPEPGRGRRLERAGVAPSPSQRHCRCRSCCRGRGGRAGRSVRSRAGLAAGASDGGWPSHPIMRIPLPARHGSRPAAARFASPAVWSSATSTAPSPRPPASPRWRGLRRLTPGARGHVASSQSRAEGGSAMLEDFKRALARVQTDYGFYIGCQTNPAVALAGYDLSADERSALTDPRSPRGLLRRGIGISRLRPITVTIYGQARLGQPRRADEDGEHGGGRPSTRRSRTEVEAITAGEHGRGRAQPAVRAVDGTDRLSDSDPAVQRGLAVRHRHRRHRHRRDPPAHPRGGRGHPPLQAHVRHRLRLRHPGVPGDAVSRGDGARHLLRARQGPSAHLPQDGRRGRLRRGGRCSGVPRHVRPSLGLLLSDDADQAGRAAARPARRGLPGHLRVRHAARRSRAPTSPSAGSRCTRRPTSCCAGDRSRTT